MSESALTRDDAPLRDLWRRRTELDDREWTALYEICTRVLTHRCNDLLASLPGPAEGYVLDFIEDKVWKAGEGEGEIDHTGALINFYRNYLTSRLRDAYVRRRDDAPAAGSPGEQMERWEVALAEESLALAAQGDGEGLAELVDLVEAALAPDGAGAGHAAGRASLDVLFERYLGLRLSALYTAAQAFLAAEGEWAGLAEKIWWIQLYLREYFCPDREHATPMSTLAREYQIPSYHYRALELGVTVPLDPAKAAKCFHGSLRARWLKSVGIPVDADHRAEVAVALKVLCIAALSGQEQPFGEERP